MKTGNKTLLKIIFFDRPFFRILIIISAVLSAVLGLTVPYYQKIFSTSLEPSALYICVILSLGYLMFNQLTLYIGQAEAVHAQKKIAEAVYRKNLTLKALTLQNKTVGEMVSLYTTDIPSLTVWLEQSIPQGLTTLFPLLLTPLFLHHFYNLNFFFSFGFVFFLILASSLMAYRQSNFFFKFKVLAAERMGLVNEWVQNIRGLKILNWIEGFEKKIIKKRREETTNRIGMLLNGQVMNSVSSGLMFWLNLALLAFFIWYYDKAFTKADIISLLWITTVFLSRPLRQLPWFFTFVFDAWTSYKRLAQFLNLKNINEIIKSNIPSDAELILETQNLNLTLNKNVLLKNINLKIYGGEIIALVGPVGAGKSLLLKSLIQETPFTADLFYSKKISYLPQEHFIMNATLRDNMNFNYSSAINNDDKVMQHLAQAQFSFELDRVQNGLDTIIGERGLNLSGGQKQRVSLARQLMHPLDLLLLDDPLSAVDIITEKKMIDEFLVLKSLQRSILITTQRFSALPYCDRIIYINNGEIEFDGKPEYFLNNISYQSFIKGLI